jgi:hypothetical protein
MQVGAGPAAEIRAAADAGGHEAGRLVLGRGRWRDLLRFLQGRIVFGAERPVFSFRHFASFDLAGHRLIGILAPIFTSVGTRVPRC